GARRCVAHRAGPCTAQGHARRRIVLCRIVLCRVVLCRVVLCRVRSGCGLRLCGHRGFVVTSTIDQTTNVAGGSDGDRRCDDCGQTLSWGRDKEVQRSTGADVDAMKRRVACVDLIVSCSGGARAWDVLANASAKSEARSEIAGEWSGGGVRTERRERVLGRG